MISPLVSPTSGYSTLSKLDRRRVRPSTSTATVLPLTDDLLGSLVGADALEAGEPEPALDRPLRELHLHDHLGAYPGDRPAAHVRRHRDERRRAHHVGSQAFLHAAQRRRGEAGADLAGVH